MEITSQHPLVSVAVIAYNSAEYILETLESIKAQTYDNIELIVSDDCSTDNTLDICRRWIDDNQTRFANVRIVESPFNTGQSGNYNRAFDACRGDWIKEIDGDDCLLPGCISEYINYIKTHPNATYIFGKMDYLGIKESDYERFEKIFDYNFFSWPREKQLNFLIFNRNCVPSPTSFYSRDYINAIGFRNDERIPLMEDWPKWIKLIQLGVNFHFLDKEVVSYRINSGISTTPNISIQFFKSNVLFELLYRYPVWIAADSEIAVHRMADFICEQYQLRLFSENEVKKLRHTRAYRLGKTMLAPFSWLKRIIIK